MRLFFERPRAGFRRAESAAEAVFEFGDEFVASVWATAAQRLAEFASASATLIGVRQAVTPVAVGVEFRPCPQV